MSEWLLVHVSIWLSMSAWFLGATARFGAFPPSSPTFTRWDRTYRVAWLIGALLVIVHITASYGYVHHWSHQAALRATAERSASVVGIRAGWGVYVNFVFAAVWLAYGLVMVVRGRRIPILDPAVFVFLSAIVIAATMVFESGAIRWAAVTGMVILAGVAIVRRRPAGRVEPAS